MKALLPLVALVLVQPASAQEKSRGPERPAETSGVTFGPVPIDPATDGEHCVNKTRLEVRGVAKREFYLTWKEDRGANAFVVQRSTNGTDYAKLAELPAGVTKFKVLDLSPGTYWFRVQAVHDPR